MKIISPERQRIAKIFKAHIDRAILELGEGYARAQLCVCKDERLVTDYMNVKYYFATTHNLNILRFAFLTDRRENT